MKISKTPQGYLVEPETDRDEKALHLVVQDLTTGPGNTEEAAPKLFDVDIVTDRVGFDLVNFVRVMRALGSDDRETREALLEGVKNGSRPWRLFP